MSLQLMHYLLHGNPHYKSPPPSTRTKSTPIGEQRSCMVCGEKFEITAKGQGKIYCSVHCKNKARVRNAGKQLPAQHCEICKTEFTPRRFGQKTCSPDCSEKLKNVRNKENKERMQTNWRSEETCSECGAKFIKRCAIQYTCSSHCSKRRGWRQEGERRKSARKLQAVQVG